MPMTISQKILASHSEKESVSPGEIIQVNVDLALANDITAPLAIKVFDELGAKDVFDREKVVLVPDHFVPNKDISSAQQSAIMRKFARKHAIKNYFEQGQSGIEHVIIPEKGLAIPGDLVIGADSHTCTYGALGAFSAGVGSTDLGVIMATGKTWLKVPESIKVIYEGKRQPWVEGKDLILYTIGQIGVEGATYKSLEFTGSTVMELPMEHRLTMANMAVEAGAKNGIFPTDGITRSYVENRTDRKGVYFESDPDAQYEMVLHIDVNKISPQVAMPSSPENVKPVSEVRDVAIDQAFIGSCTNGRLEDLRTSAEILKGRSVADGVRLIVIPGSPYIYKEAVREGIIETLLDAGAVIGPPCCGPCLGGHMGILAEGERAVSTTNRNFVGRMGHPESEVYLSSPPVAAASAILGKIASPEEL
ncbi:3-isopropylmalate dehydratase large subunit [Thermodesulfobacteriota bacterium]